MRKILLLLLMLPSLMLGANGITINKEEAYQQPAGWVDRVSKRGPEWKVLQDRASFYGETTDTTFQLIIFPAPVHYDSAGTWRELKAVSAPDTAAGYNLSVKTGRFSVDIDTLTGAFRFLRDTGSKKGSIRFTPAFSPANVPIEYDLSGRGLKATYTLNSGNRLAWGYTRTSALDTTDAKGKGKGKLKDSLAQVKAEIQEFTAVDANQQPVPLTTTWTADSLIVVLDTAGAAYPIFVDPTIQDTASATASARLRNTLGGWAGERDATVADDVYAGVTIASIAASTTNFYRYALTFRLDTVAVGSVVDSARLVLRVSYAGAGGSTLAVLQGTWTGGTPAADWFNDFKGWAASGAYTTTNMVESDFSWANAADTTTHIKLMSAAGLDTLKAKLSARNDSLRLMLVFRRDITNTSNSDGTVDNITIDPAPYVQIFWHPGNPPGLSTLADTALASAILVGEIDSTGGVNCTARGFQWWVDADTTTLSKSGSFAAGEFQDTVKALPLSVTVSFRSFATNGNGTSYGSVMTFTTGAGGGVSTSVFVDGRRVDHIR